MPKKTKAIKKTDRDGNKPWLKKKGITKIEVPHISPRRTFLIVSEGQTEEVYFKAFRRNSITVKCISLGCSNMQLVDCVIDLKEGESYDEVWAVFDMDYHSAERNEQYANFDNAIKKGIKHGIKVAYSNDCFELWFYLHYHFTEQQNLRYFYYKELGKLWGINYEKEGKTRKFAQSIFRKIEDDEKASSEKAIKRAKALLNKKKDLPYHQQNPITTVYKLIEALLKS